MSHNSLWLLRWGVATSHCSVIRPMLLDGDARH